MSKRKLIVNSGFKVDASLSESPFNPKGMRTYEMAVDRDEEERNIENQEKEEIYHKVQKQPPPGSDHEAKRVKKGKKSIFGYKKPIGTDEEGMILGVHTTPANEHDSRGLERFTK